MQKNKFFHELAIVWSAKKWSKDTFFLFSITFPLQILQMQQQWHFHCFAILGSTSIDIHSVTQRLLRSQPGSGSCNLSWLLAQKIMKGIHSCKPAWLNCPISHLPVPLQDIKKNRKKVAIYWSYITRQRWLWKTGQQQPKSIHKACRACIGWFSEAGLHEWMPFVIFHAKSCDRSQHPLRANFWVGIASCCV